MGYKKLIENLKAWDEEYIVPACGDGNLQCEHFCLPDKDCLVTQAATAITDLLARAEEAETREKNLIEAVQMATARAEKAEKKLEAAVGTIYALVADCPPEACKEICANHDGVCSKHAKMGRYDHCKGFKWIGEGEE